MQRRTFFGGILGIFGLGVTSEKAVASTKLQPLVGKVMNLRKIRVWKLGSEKVIPTKEACEKFSELLTKAHTDKNCSDIIWDSNIDVLEFYVNEDDVNIIANQANFVITKTEDGETKIIVDRNAALA